MHVVACIAYARDCVYIVFMSKKLLEEIEAFLSETGTGTFRFGIKAAKNGRLIERLRAGGRVWPETETQHEPRDPIHQFHITGHSSHR